jgi:RNA polymerase sigma factor (sigma-70 family)
VQRFGGPARLWRVQDAPADSGVGVGAVGGVGFEELYRAEWSRLVRIALLMTGSREAAEDVVHDAFVRFAGASQPVSNPSAYVRSTVVNLVRDLHRHARIEARPLRACAGSWADQDIDETWWALQALPPRYRAPLALRFYADLTVDDVAGVLGCPAGTAKSLIHRGLRLLKERLP